MLPIIHWNLLSLEILMTMVLAILIIVHTVRPNNTHADWIGRLSFWALFGLLVFWLGQYPLTGLTLSGMFAMDALAWFFKTFFLIVMVFVFTMTHQFFKPFKARRDEFYLLLWLALLGLCFMASSSDFLLMFIALEIFTISLYVMTAYLKSDRLSIEAGMKYLILGSLSSGFFLYGTSLLYGSVHSTNFKATQAFVLTHGMDPMAALGLVLIFAAVGFKMAVVPFHMWVPDVYQGAPTPVTALLSVGSKAAGFVIVLRLFFQVFAGWQAHWTLIMAILSAVTMTYGNLLAMAQTNMKRFLGYSSIAHAGYLLMGVAAGGILGAAGINFYLLGYLFTNFGAFLVIVLFSMATSRDAIEDYAGLASRSSLLALTMLLALVSLAGMPPLAGFFGKFILLMAVIKSGYLWLAVIAGANIVISLYYYLMIAKRIYVEAPYDRAAIPISVDMRLLLYAAIIGIVTIGIFQGPFLEAAITAVKGP